MDTKIYITITTKAFQYYLIQITTQNRAAVLQHIHIRHKYRMKP